MGSKMVSMQDYDQDVTRMENLPADHGRFVLINSLGTRQGKFNGDSR